MGNGGGVYNSVCTSAIDLHTHLGVKSEKQGAEVGGAGGGCRCAERRAVAVLLVDYLSRGLKDSWMMCVEILLRRRLRVW